MDESALRDMPPVEPDAAHDVLSDWELGVVDLFVRGAQIVGISKSMGQIYGLLFCREGPLPMDEIVSLLSISKGSASQGLRTLRQLGAVTQTYRVGDRRDHYQAEVKLRKLVSGFLDEQVEPHLVSGADRLHHLRAVLPSQDEDAAAHDFAHKRLNLLEAWHFKARKLLPLVQKFI